MNTLKQRLNQVTLRKVVFWAFMAVHYTVKFAFELIFALIKLFLVVKFLKK
jgi:hypothetical protein